jgi:hypothetical protein
MWRAESMISGNGKHPVTCGKSDLHCLPQILTSMIDVLRR